MSAGRCGRNETRLQTYHGFGEAVQQRFARNLGFGFFGLFLQMWERERNRPLAEDRATI